MLELSLWVSENIGWPVVGWWMTGFVAAVAVAWIVVEARYERDRKRRRRAWAERDREDGR